MEQFFIAVTISVFIMMGCTLFVLFWEMIDNKRSVILDKEVHQQVINFLGREDKTNINLLINEATLNHINSKE